MKLFKHRQQKGFTLVEMLVVAPIVILAIGGFLTVIISMTGEVLASRASNNLSYNVQDALNHIDQDVKLSSSFMSNDYIPQTLFGAAQGFDDNNLTTSHFTNVGGTSGTSLILNMVATDSNPISPSSSYVFLKNQPNACASPQSKTIGNKPFAYTVVYYVKNGNLYRRVMMPTNYTDTTNTVCVVPWQQPSCSPTYMDAQSGSVYCKTKDVELVDGVGTNGFNVQYYNGQSATTVNLAASDTSTSGTAADTNRNIALQSSTTVGVSIDATQSAAGRTVERNAVLRTSRLDSNASGVESIVADGAPAAPTVAGSITEPTYATFKWGSVPLATGYTIQYQINGGSVQTGFTNSNTFSYTVTTSTHKDVVTASVVAINGNVTPNASSSPGTASVTAPLWASPFLQNSWTNFGQGYATAGYTKTSSGLVVLKGMVKGGSGTILTLPAGYRPANGLIFANTSNGALGRLDVTPSGALNMSAGTNAWFSLDGIAFYPSSATFTPVTYQNGWLDYSPGSGDPNWEQTGYLTDSIGRVMIQGMDRSGTTTSGTAMFTLPAGDRPAEYMHILNTDQSAAGHFSIAADGTVQAKGYSNVWETLQELFFPSSRAVGSTCTTQWCSITLQNSWTWYGAPYSTPLYTKSSDGLVMLKGLVKGGSSATAIIATLPAGYCPGETDSLMSTASNGVWSRLDIARNPVDGTCTLNPSSGASTAWVSLDDLRWIAEP